MPASPMDGEIHPVEMDGATGDAAADQGQKPGYGKRRQGFSGAAFADEAENLATVERQVDPVEQTVAADIDADVAQAEKGGHSPLRT